MNATTRLIPFKLDAETLDLIERLKAHLQPSTIGRPLTRADIVRHALRTLATQTIGESEVKEPIKKRKKNTESA